MVSLPRLRRKPAQVDRCSVVPTSSGSRKRGSPERRLDGQRASLLRPMACWSPERQADRVIRSRRAQVLAWVMPSLALLLLSGGALACVLTAVHAAPLDAAYRASPESGRGVLAARPAHVMAADSALAVAWMASLPVAVVATLLAASARDRFRAQGTAAALATVVTVIGLLACFVGLVVAALGACRLLLP